MINSFVLDQKVVRILSTTRFYSSTFFSFLTDVGQFVTTITLDHTLFTGLSNSPQRPAAATAPPAWTPRPPPPPPTTRLPFRPQTEPPIYQPPIHVPTARPNSNEDVHNEFNFECGASDYRAPTATGLLVGGQNANRGQFPW